MIFINIYINYLILRNNIWNFFKLLQTALMYASDYGCTETVKMLVEQEGIDINAKYIYLYLLLFISTISYFKKIIKNYSNYYLQYL